VFNALDSTNKVNLLTMGVLGIEHIGVLDNWMFHELIRHKSREALPAFYDGQLRSKLTRYFNKGQRPATSMR